MWRTALLGLAAALFLAACGGGSSGSVEYGATVVPIKHLDLSNLELTMVDFMNPPFADQFPVIVATVNGEDITGRGLASQEVLLDHRPVGNLD